MFGKTDRVDKRLGLRCRFLVIIAIDVVTTIIISIVDHHHHHVSISSSQQCVLHLQGNRTRSNWGRLWINHKNCFDFDLNRLWLAPFLTWRNPRCEGSLWGRQRKWESGFSGVYSITMVVNVFTLMITSYTAMLCVLCGARPLRLFWRWSHGDAIAPATETKFLMSLL